MASLLAPMKVKILVLSPPPSTCADPGPWHDSQPRAPWVILDSCVVIQCGDDSNPLYSSSWHPWQVVAPTYWPSDTAAGCALACWAAELDCAPARAVAKIKTSKTTDMDLIAGCARPPLFAME